VKLAVLKHFRSAIPFNESCLHLAPHVSIAGSSIASEAYTALAIGEVEHRSGQSGHGWPNAGHQLTSTVPQKLTKVRR
jgi:hypothetical protein